MWITNINDVELAPVTQIGVVSLDSQISKIKVEPFEVQQSFHSGIRGVAEVNSPKLAVDPLATKVCAITSKNYRADVVKKVRQNRLRLRRAAQVENHQSTGTDSIRIIAICSYLINKEPIVSPCSDRLRRITDINH